MANRNWEFGSGLQKVVSPDTAQENERKVRRDTQENGMKHTVDIIVKSIIVHAFLKTSIHKRASDKENLTGVTTPWQTQSTGLNTCKFLFVGHHLAH